MQKLIVKRAFVHKKATNTDLHWSPSEIVNHLKLPV